MPSLSSFLYSCERISLNSDKQVMRIGRNNRVIHVFFSALSLSLYILDLNVYEADEKKDAHAHSYMTMIT